MDLCQTCSKPKLVCSTIPDGATTQCSNKPSTLFTAQKPRPHSIAFCPDHGQDTRKNMKMSGSLLTEGPIPDTYCKC